VTSTTTDIDDLLHPIPAGWTGTFARGPHKEAKKGDWKNGDFDLASLISALTTHTVGPKDGRCFLQGRCAGGHRQARAMEELYVIGIDVDNGMPSTEIDRIIKERGLFAIRYTTHSHGKDYTEVRQDDFVKYQRLHPGATISEYLIEKKRYLPEIAEDAQIAGNSMGAGGLVLRVTHAPMDKNRLVFILSKPWTLTELTSRGLTQDEAIKEWRSLYLNFAAWLGIPADESCTDPSRLFYLPRHDMGAIYESVVHEGMAVNLWAVPKSIRGGDQSVSNPYLDAAKDMGAREDVSETMRQLTRWAGKGNADRFLIYDALLDHAEHVLRPEKDAEGKHHIECPFEDEHGEYGGTGTFVMNAGESSKGTFVIHCRHNSCQGHRQDKLVMLEAMLDKGWLPAEALNDPNYLIEMEDDPVEDDDEPDYDEPSDRDKVTVTTTVARLSADQAEKKLRKMAEDDWSDLKVEQEFDKLAQAVGMSRSTLKGVYNKIKKAVAKEREDDRRAEAAIKADKERKKEMANLAINRERDTIYVDTDFLMAVSKAMRALEESNEGSEYIFRFAGGLARVVKDEYGLWKTERMEQKVMRHVLARTTRFLKDAGDGNFREISPPTDVVDDILANPSPNFPPLYGVANAPVFGADGTLLTTPGYSHSSMLYFAPTEGFNIPKIPKKPSQADVDKALDLLLGNVLVDFPFDGPDNGAAERAHALCMLLQPFVRQMIDGPCPIHLIAKPTPGTGASKLVGVYSLIAHGESAIAQTECRGEDEMRKRITSVLAEGRHTFYLDNVNFKVDSSSLASATTADMWTDRLLGSTSTVRVPIRLVWIIAGNNPMLSNELARRCIRSRLDAKIERPEERRGFKHADLEGWVKANRAELVWACLVLVQNWLAQGRPEPDRVKGSYEAWSRVIGGILKANGVPGFLGNEDEMRNDADEEGAAIKTFLSMWWTTYQDQETTIGGDGNGLDEGLVGIIEEADVPLPVTGNTPRALKISLGRYLSKLKGRRFRINDGSTDVLVEIEAVQAKNGYSQYRLKTVQQ